MSRIFSGVQPTGELHLGNYLGAIRNWVRLQDDYECLFCVVDMHAITAWQDPGELRANTREVAAAMLASGVDPKRHIVFNQSQVAGHAELAWIFNCVARLGWLNRMTQFKEKAGKHKEKASIGLYAYPVLMAADILLYKATHVPVGEDQKQHLELTRDIAQKFNNDFKKDLFPIVEPLIFGAATRVMSLRDGTKKMSKSDPSEQSRITMTDDADAIARKVRKAKTDPDPLPDSPDGLEGRPEAANLLGIYAALSDADIKDVCQLFGGQQFSGFKQQLADLAVAKLSPIQDEMRRLMDDPGHVDRVLRGGAERAREMAAPVGGSQKQEVEVCIHAPESMTNAFDDWGRPQAGFWQQRVLQQPDDEGIYLAANPAGQKDAVLGFLRSRREPADHAVAVGCADGDVLPVLRRGLESAGVAVFDPDGESFSNHALYHFLANFSKLLSDGRFRDFLEMLRNSAWLDSLNRQFEESNDDQESHFDAVKVMQAFDSLNERALPGSFEDAMESLRRDRERDDKYTRPLPGQWFAGDAVAAMLKRFREQTFAEAFAALLSDWLGTRQLRSDEADAQLLAVIGERSRHLADEMSQVVGGDRVNPADLFELMLADLAGVHYYPGDRKASDLELQGWLELPWESADDLVVSGLNEGLVPVAVVGDMFLPESARKVLGLKTNEERFARDLYLLESMLCWREQSGGVIKILVGKASSSGDLLKPSRLLFQCEEGKLPARAKRLFADADLSGAEQSVPPWNLCWTLRPPFDREVLLSKVPTSLSATTFSGFLACPFRFILKRTLGMQEVDPKKSEMNAMGFGSLCHRALEVLSAGSDLGKETKYEAIYDGLVNALREEIDSQFGANPPATVLLQAETAVSRLKVVACYHADALAEGWEVVATEKVFGKEEEWLLGGFPLTGTIDRVEKNADGRYRLIDYKTSSTASTAFDAHLQPLKRGEQEEDYPDWMLYELPEDGKTYRWVNLQLPVYCLWAEQHLASEGKVDCAYVNLPKALGDGGFSEWQGGMDAPLLRSAKRCAEGVIGEVKRGNFWPPTEKVKYDDYEDLGFPDFVSSLDHEAFEKVFSVKEGE